ncbi:exonuclease DPD1, chloroplastic/mitochondrial [Quillaja saponaria]|uniref:Exonuclease DPD1, chloroplastic/mitochondrial n=1 Tax=Quillaja saponaria TaxID=32244 RepID=A0AAD7LBQ0_QUISA|nr:exonuclease DPD1, chloroplastic/mitochondrial [Quillaja saponaria]
MRTIYSLFQVSRFRIARLPYLGLPSLGNFWTGNFCLSRFFHRSGSEFKLLGSNSKSTSEAGVNKTVLRSTAAGTEHRTSVTVNKKPSNRTHDSLNTGDVPITISDSASNCFKSIEYSDAQKNLLANRDLKHLVKVFVVDIETTGFSRQRERIIEIAIRDLEGGMNSCLQTLVNPERDVPNSHIHGVTTKMVKQPDVPRMEELIPILLKYIKSRQIHGGLALFVGHNARCFDVPFLKKEFSRCSFDIPADWLFLDTLPLAREMMKLNGSKISPKASLSALCEYYDITSADTEHRAMSDVHLLSEIFGKLTFDLKLSVSDLLERSFRASDLIKLKK